MTLLSIGGVLVVGVFGLAIAILIEILTEKHEDKDEI